MIPETEIILDVFIYGDGASAIESLSVCPGYSKEERA